MSRWNLGRRRAWSGVSEYRIDPGLPMSTNVQNVRDECSIERRFFMTIAYWRFTISLTLAILTHKDVIAVHGDHDFDLIGF